MVRTPSYDRNGMKKGAWSPEEDGLLRTYITKYGHWNWRELPKFAGLKRCGKSCRLRWMNYLRPDLKHGSYTKQEEDLIIQLHQQHGNKWAVIASNLPGRTDNEIKNHWHSHLKKRPKHQKPTTPTNSTAKISLPKPSRSDLSDKPKTRKLMSDNICHHIQILESCPFPSLKMPPASMSSCTTPMSSELSTCNLSSFDISTVKFDDDGGLEELMNSSELFTELSSLSPLGLDNEMELNMDYELHTTSWFSANRESEASTGMDVCGEIEFQDEDFWCNSFIDTNQVLLSPSLNYCDDDLLDFFCHQSQIMEDFPYKVNTSSFECSF